MLDKKINSTTIVLICYLICIVLVGLVFIPCYEVWGPEKNLRNYVYVGLFDLMKDRFEINGFNVIYQIDSFRLLYTIGIITLIFAIIWIINKQWEREDQIHYKPEEIIKQEEL